MAATRRCILLAGAPDRDDLSWDESLLPGVDPPFAPVLRGQPEPAPDAHEASTLALTAEWPKWRSLELVEGDQGSSGNRFPHTRFLSIQHSGAVEEPEHLDFLEHSIAIFDDLVSSQVLPCVTARDDAAAADATTDFATSFATTSASDTSFNTTSDTCSPVKNGAPLPRETFAGAISNLKQIPTADYISRISPQTMTVDLLVGIVTASPARTVHLKKSDTEMDIIELVVGDESHAGFTVSFWLVPAESQNKPADDPRAVLQGLRAGDVVLLRHVALSCFRGCVYGQSLNRRFARNSTTVVLLDDHTRSSAPASLLAKLQRVQSWACEFVGAPTRATASERDQSANGRKTIDALPPDTQD